MKIWIVTTHGITAAYDNWPERLQARGFAQRNHQVWGITYRGKRDIISAEHEIIDNVPVERYTPSWFSLKLFRKLLFSPRPDIVHLHHLSNQFGFITALVCKIRRIPLVFTPHGLFHNPYLVVDRDRPFNAPARYSALITTLPQLCKALASHFKPKRHLKNYLNHAPLRMANRVLPLSQHGREVLLKLGVKPERIVIVPNAIDPDEGEGNSELRPELAGHTGEVVLYLGQLKYRKGFDLLAQAAESILTACPTAIIVIATHSPIHRAELIEIAGKWYQQERLILLEDVTDPQKLGLFRRAAQNGCYVLPTRYEGFGIPLIEAMAAGCPVISSNIPVINELIKPGENGLLFPLDDVNALAGTIISLLKDETLRQKLIANGRKTVPRYFTPLVLDEIEQIYRQLS